MAGHTFVYVSGLVLLPGAVIAQEHNLMECQSVHHKIKTFSSKMEMILSFTRCHLSLFSCTDQKHKVCYESYREFSSLLCAKLTSAFLSEREILWIL